MNHSSLFLSRRCLLILFLIILNACGPKKEEGDGGNPTDRPEIEVPTSGYIFTPISELELGASQPTSAYSPRGVGGGGAMSGFSISPYSSLWFVGTDMGTLFRSVDRGTSWHPVSHFQTTFSSLLDVAVNIGFSSDPYTLFHAPAGINPVRSTDGGITWYPVASFPLSLGENIKYWRSIKISK